MISGAATGGDVCASDDRGIANGAGPSLTSLERDVAKEAEDQLCAVVRTRRTCVCPGRVCACGRRAGSRAVRGPIRLSGRVSPWARAGGQRRRRQLGEHPRKRPRSEVHGDNRRGLSGSTPTTSSGTRPSRGRFALIALERRPPLCASWDRNRAGVVRERNAALMLSGL